MKKYIALLILIFSCLTKAHAGYDISKSVELRAAIEKEIMARNELLDIIGAPRSASFIDAGILTDVNSYELATGNLLEMLEAFLESLNQSEDSKQRQGIIKKFKSGAGGACSHISYQMGVAAMQVSTEKIRTRVEIQHKNIGIACNLLSGFYFDGKKPVTIF